MTTQSLQYSYSGADCDVFAIRDPSDIKQLKSVATVSVSVYDAKAPVRALGHRSVKGYTGSIRTVAGSIVFIVVEGHPLEDLMNKNSGRYHADLNDLQVERLPNKTVGNSYAIGGISPFNLMLMYKNEIGNSAGLEIDNLEFVSEGIVTSVNDMVTEVVVQFVATDFRQLTRAKKDENQLRSLSTTLQAPEDVVRRILIDLGYSADDVYNLAPDIIEAIQKELIKLAEEEVRLAQAEEEFEQGLIDDEKEFNDMSEYARRSKNKRLKEEVEWLKQKSQGAIDAIDKFIRDRAKYYEEKRDEELRRKLQHEVNERARAEEASKLKALTAEDQGAADFFQEYKKDLEENRRMQREVDKASPGLHSAYYGKFLNKLMLDDLRKSVEAQKKKDFYDKDKAFGKSTPGRLYSNAFDED